MRAANLTLLLTFVSLMVGGVRSEDKNPTVIIETSLGNIEVELDKGKAPKTVENFMGYVKDKFYDGTIFHRVIDGFMVQGGGFSADLKQKATKKPIQNEADNGLKNSTGTIAMARTDDPHSASAEFYINVNDNNNLDHRNKTKAGWGYCVFGKVTAGMDVVNKIKAVKTGDGVADFLYEGQVVKAPLQNVPKEAITIKSVREKQ